MSAEYIDLMKQTRFDCIIGGIEFRGCIFSDIECRLDKWNDEYFVYTMHYDYIEWTEDLVHVIDK